MKVLNLIFSSIILATIILGCDHKSHIEEYNIDIKELQKLPDNFYAFRRGNLYYSNEDYMIWFNRTINGNLKNIIRINDLRNTESNIIETIKLYNIDTVKSKIIAQQFIELSEKFKFGHIKIDKKNKIAFSHRDGLVEQYVKVFNDSLKKKYDSDNDFKLLSNGWYECVGD